MSGTQYFKWKGEFCGAPSTKPIQLVGFSLVSCRFFYLLERFSIACKVNARLMKLVLLKLEETRLILAHLLPVGARYLAISQVNETSLPFSVAHKCDMIKSL